MHDTATLYGGQLKLAQNKTGYRFGVDSVLLAAFAEPGHERTLDLGTGSGVVALQILLEEKSERAVGLEVQAGLVELAQRNVASNAFDERAQIVRGDLREREVMKALGRFDRVVMNPPYWPAEAGRLPPNEEKAIAKHKLLGGLDDWLNAARSALHVGGVLELIYPVERMADVMWRAVSHKLQPQVLTLVYPQPKSEARFMLLRCVRGAQGGLRITEPWFIQLREGKTHRRFAALKK